MYYYTLYNYYYYYCFLSQVQHIGLLPYRFTTTPYRLTTAIPSATQLIYSCLQEVYPIKIRRGGMLYYLGVLLNATKGGTLFFPLPQLKTIGMLRKPRIMITKGTYTIKGGAEHHLLLITLATKYSIRIPMGCGATT